MVVAAVLALPWLVFWYLLDPVNGKVLGNDFLALPFRQEYHFALLVNQGFFPLWTPDSLGGLPAAHFLFAQPYFPLNALKLLLPGYFEGGHLRFFVGQKLLLMSIGSLFFHAFLRRRGFTAEVAALGAALFMFNAPMLDALRYATAFDAFALIPVVLYLLERGVSSGARGPALLLIAPVLACQALAGYPQMLFYSLAFTNLYALHRFRSGGLAGTARALVRFGAVQLLGVAMAAVLLVPFRVDVMPYFRSVPSYGHSVEYQTSLANLLFSVAAPWFADVYGAIYSTSLATLLLLLLGTAWAAGRLSGTEPERRERRFFAGLLGVTLLLALGDQTFLHDLFWKHLPGFSSLRAPARVLVLAQTAVAVLACHGLRAFLRGDLATLRLRPLFLAVLAAVAGVAGVLLVLDTRAGGEGTLLRALLDRYVGEHSAYRLNGSEALNQKLLWQVAFYPAFFVAALALQRRRGFPKPAFVALLLCVSVLEAAQYLKHGTWYRKYADDSPRADYLARADYFHERRVPRWFRTGMLDPPPGASWELERNADAELRAFLEDSTPALRATFFNDPSPEQPLYFPRAYLVPHAILADRWDPDDVNASNPFDAVVVSLRDPANAGAGAALGAAGVGRAAGAAPPLSDPAARRGFVEANRTLRVLDYTPNRAGFGITAPGPGLLVYTDTFRPGWSVRVDGTPAALLRVNRAFKGALVPPGAHTVEFLYFPRSFRLGLAVSLAASVAFAGLLCWQTAPRRRGAATAVVVLLAAGLAALFQARIVEMALARGRVGIQERSLDRLLKRNLRTVEATRPPAPE
jgi:hypothetical protein